MERPIAKVSFAKTTVHTGFSPGMRALPMRVKQPACSPVDTFEQIRGLQPWKRAVDVAVSVTAIVVFAPLVGLVAGLVKLTSRGPVFVAQERVGLNRRTRERRRNGASPPGLERRRETERREADGYGKPFKMYKFRSMKDGAENGRPVWAVEKDPRITAVGRILRKTRIDEIPQFLNVLRGDMSVVGPRPERRYFYGELQREVPDFACRLRTKPGITGLAQVNHGYANTVPGMRVKLGHDLDYIRNLRPSTDAKILLKTVSVVLTGKGAF